MVFGGGAGFPATFDLNSLNGAYGFIIQGVDREDNTGISVSSAGDVNGDGFDDLIVGAEKADDEKGKAFVVFGRDTTQPGIDFPRKILLTDLDGNDGFSMVGVAANDRAGYSVTR